MTSRPDHLMRSRRFLPLFITQFLGAMNDNLFKNAMVILILYRLAGEGGTSGQIMVTAAAGVFILPFFLFSALAGQLADRFDKARLIQAIKLAEVAIMGCGVWGLVQGDSWLLMGVLFAMGTHSAFFGPLKYGILPDHLAQDELVGGNALIEAGTFLAILIGTIAGGVLILTDHGTAIVSTGMVGLAALGLAASLFIPRTRAAAPGLRINPNFLGETVAIIRNARERRDVFLSILGISWFWLVGATFLSQFPAFAKDVLHADQHVVTLFLTVFSVGIGLGSMLCGRLLAGEISAKFVPLAAVGITLFSVDLYLASGHGAIPATGLAGVGDFLAHAANWHILADLLLIALCGGLYIVPLYAILQSRSEESHRSRVVAANNVVNAAFMVLSAVATSALLAAGFGVHHVFLVMAVANGAAAVHICRLLPEALIKQLLAGLFRLAYKAEIRGLEFVPPEGERVVMIANHVSFLDAALLATFLPGKPVFAVNTQIAQRWWAKIFLSLVEAYPLDPTKPLATKGLIRAVQEGKRLVIFPEGRITVTGALMKIYEGPGMIADKAQAKLLPIRIDGAQFTPFSRLRGKVRLRLFPRVAITVQPPRAIEVAPDLKGRLRRQAIGLRLYDVMADMIFATSDCDASLFGALLDARATHGGGATAIEDIERKPRSFNQIVTGSFVLGRRLAALSEKGEIIGLLLPNAVASAVTFFGLQAFGRVPAMLNFSAGLATMQSACTAAQIRTVVTSRRFVEAARLTETVQALGGQVKLVYLEDIRARIGIHDKLYGLGAALFARRKPKHESPDAPAVVLFTSGSEGKPKGVVLSHRNILANCRQVAARIDFTPSDVVFNALPIFHSFGLTGGLLLPLLSGVRIFLYPSPLHYRIVPELTYDTNATILFGTDTFLAGYARSAHAYDFYSLRYVVAGAEPVKDETRRVWIEKFGLRILEGYGATETSPVLALNTPMQFKRGSVGRLLPGIRHRLDPVPGIERGGRLVVSGPNVMKGYLRHEAPGLLQPPPDGWYDTGDIVDIDERGFVSIQGRAKRFAKIGGEMVSLTAVEAQAQDLWPDHHHAVVALADARKGEQLVLVTDNPAALRAALLEDARKRGITELAVPKQILTLDKLPVLGTGKTDYVAVEALVKSQAAAELPAEV